MAGTSSADRLSCRDTCQNPSARGNAAVAESVVAVVVDRGEKRRFTGIEAHVPELNS
jgi:hypothetical protein